MWGLLLRLKGSWAGKDLRKVRSQLLQLADNVPKCGPAEAQIAVASSREGSGINQQSGNPMIRAWRVPYNDPFVLAGINFRQPNVAIHLS